MVVALPPLSHCAAWCIVFLLMLSLVAIQGHLQAPHSVDLVPISSPTPSHPIYVLGEVRLTVYFCTMYARGVSVLRVVALNEASVQCVTP